MAQTGILKGTIQDTATQNQPLPFANVLIKGTTKGALSDFDGNFVIENIQPGTYTVEFSFVGYKTKSISNITISQNQTTALNTSLEPSAAALDEIIIKTSTRKETEAALLLDQERATTIKQSIGAVELARKGVSNAAAAVSKISGISKQEGGGNVYVRGLGDRYLNTTYNNLPVPSNSIENKNIDLNLFASDIIQNVSVSKTYNANFYGDFAAGNVNITGKEYSGDFFLNIDLGSNVNSNTVGENLLKSEGTGYFGFYNRYKNNPFAVILSHGVDAINTERNLGINGSLTTGKSWDIGEESRLSIFATANFSNNYEFLEGTAVDFTTVEKKRFPNAVEHKYNRNTTLMTNIGYRFNSNHKIKFNALFINDASDEVGFYGTKGQGTNRDAILNTDKGFFQSNIQFEQDMIYVNQLIGTNHINDKLKLDWGLGYNKVFARQPDRKRISVERYDLELDQDPNTNASFFSNIPFDNQRYFQSIEDSEFNARINLKYQFSENIKFNFGYNGRLKKRDFENIRYGYDLIQPNTPIDNVFNLNTVFNAENIGSVYNTAVFNAIDSSLGLGSTNLPGLPENTYNGALNSNAAYTDAALQLNQKLSITPGLRLEYFNQEITYDVINISPTDPGFRNVDNLFVLPSLNIKYKLKEKQNLRIAFSSTVSTPEFKEVAPFVYEDVTQRIGGNPSLLENPSFSRILNLDLKYEWFLKKGEIFSVAAFAKAIYDPINLVVANDATGTQRFFRTGKKAEVLGFEAEFRKTLLRNNADDASVLAIGANATYTYTKQDLQTVNGLFSTSFDRKSDQLQGASPFLLNADISFSPTIGNYKPIANVVFSYFSDRIYALGSGALGNIIEKSVPTLDFVWKNKINKHFELNTSFKNLLDPTIKRVRNTTTENVTLAAYKRGININLQAKYIF